MKAHWERRTELRDSLGHWHPLGKWTALFTVLPAVVVLSLSAQALGLAVGFLIWAAVIAAVEFVFGLWAKHKASYPNGRRGAE